MGLTWSRSSGPNVARADLLSRSTGMGCFPCFLGTSVESLVASTGVPATVRAVARALRRMVVLNFMVVIVVCRCLWKI